MQDERHGKVRAAQPSKTRNVVDFDVSEPSQEASSVCRCELIMVDADSHGFSPYYWNGHRIV